MIILLLSIDATKSVGMARYVNDSPEAYANCRPKQNCNRWCSSHCFNCKRVHTSWKRALVKQ